MGYKWLQTIDPNFQPDIQVGVLTNRFIAIFFGPTVVEKLGGVFTLGKEQMLHKNIAPQKSAPGRYGIGCQIVASLSWRNWIFSRPNHGNGYIYLQYLKSRWLTVSTFWLNWGPFTKTYLLVSANHLFWPLGTWKSSKLTIHKGTNISITWILWEWLKSILFGFHALKQLG